MKIVLREDVENLGEKGTVKQVADGYARNYLIPKGLAVVATTGELKVVAENQKVRERKIARQERDLQELSDKINGQRLVFEARAGATGRLFGSVTNGDIAERLSSLVGTDIDRRKIAVDEAIRTVGDHKVTVLLVGKLKPEIIVVVNGIVETGTAEDAVAEEVAEASVEA